jgi:hypothetical protein
LFRYLIRWTPVTTAPGTSLWTVRRADPTAICRQKLQKEVIGLVPTQARATALGRAPTYEGDERTDQEHDSGSDRETCNPRPDLLYLLLDLFPFLRRHVHRSQVFQLFLRPHVFFAFRAASSPFSNYTNPIVDLKSSLSKTADDATILRSQSPIRSNSSHCRRLPLKPRLSATWKLEMRQRSICFPLFSSAIANWPCLDSPPVHCGASGAKKCQVFGDFGDFL